MAVQQNKTGGDQARTNASNPRHPDTNADRDPRAFGTIEVTETDESGPGTVDPVVMPTAAGDGGSTFASRRAARTKGPESKQVQSAENK